MSAFERAERAEARKRMERQARIRLAAVFFALGLVGIGAAMLWGPGGAALAVGLLLYRGART